MGELETTEDGSGFAYDTRYSPLVDPGSGRQYWRLNPVLLELSDRSGESMDANALSLSVDQEFAVHAAAFAVKGMDREELEEAFINVLHQKMVDRQLFFKILKEHGIDAEINFNYLTANQLS